MPIGFSAPGYHGPHPSLRRSFNKREARAEQSKAMRTAQGKYKVWAAAVGMYTSRYIFGLGIHENCVIT